MAGASDLTYIYICLLPLRIQWNPSIVATIGERPSGLYRGVATSQGFYMIALCACAYECLAAPSRPSPISRLFHAGCTSS